MPRRNDIAKLLATGLFIAAGLLPASAQISFDTYFAGVNNHQIGERQKAFLQHCEIKQRAAHVSYGLSTENEGFKFHRSARLLNGRSEAQTDFFGSAEAWWIDGRPRFVSVWMLIMDVGSESNEMFCLDMNGKVTMQESLNASYSVASGNAKWIYLQTVSIDASSKKKLIRSGYVRKDGTSATPPRLNREDAEASMSVADSGLAEEVITALSR